MKASIEGDMRVAIEVPASVANLGPGFDTLGMALDIRNRYVFGLSPSGTRISISGEGSGNLPCDEQHLAYQACGRVLSQLGVAMPSLLLEQHNAIPFAGGLGNSATAVVAGVLAANAFIGDKLTPNELLAHATKIEGHPDNVAPALLGGMVVCAGSDAGMAHVSVPLPAALRVVLAVPDFTLNTALARQALPSHVPLADATFNVAHASLLVAALCAGHFDTLAAAMQDKLHQPYRAHLVPGMEMACAAARQSGALGAALAGAGPTVMALALSSSDTDQIGQAMTSAFAQVGVNSRYIVTQPSHVGAKVERFVTTSCE